MEFSKRYPEYAAIEEHIRRARIERSVAIAHLIAAAFEVIGRGVRKLGEAFDRGLAAERDRRAVEADAFLQRHIAPHR